MLVSLSMRRSFRVKVVRNCLSFGARRKVLTLFLSVLHDTTWSHRDPGKTWPSEKFLFGTFETEQRFPRHQFDRIRTQIRPWLGPSAKRESVFQRWQTEWFLTTCSKTGANLFQRGDNEWKNESSAMLCVSTKVGNVSLLRTWIWFVEVFAALALAMVAVRN